MMQPYSSTSRVLTVRLASDSLSPIRDLGARQVADSRACSGSRAWPTFRSGLPRPAAPQVLVDPERPRDADLTLQQVVRTTGNSLWVSPLTFLEASSPGPRIHRHPDLRFDIRHEPPIKTADDLAQIPIEDDEGNAVIVDGATVQLGDVTDLVEDHQPLIGDAIFANGEAG